MYQVNSEVIWFEDDWVRNNETMQVSIKPIVHIVIDCN